MTDYERMVELVAILNRHNYNYYVLDKPTISNNEWDKLYFELIELEEKTGIVLSDSPTHKVGGEPLDKFRKVMHYKKLFSLDKAQSISEIEDWFEKNSKILGSHNSLCSIEYKFDGLTMVLLYEEGKFVRAATRGNGEIGEDVTTQVKTIRTVPLSILYKGRVEVHGEAVVKLSALEKYNKTHPEDKLKNARNAAAGAIRNLDPKVTASRNLDIIMYNVNYIEGKTLQTQSEIHEFLKENKFLVSDYFVLENKLLEIEKRIDEIFRQKKFLDILIDGVVVKYNDVSIREELGYTQKFPRGMIAFKFDAEETTTLLLGIVWQVGRTGKITPVAELEPVELSGVTVRRATLNNMNDIIRKNIRIGSTVFVRRSNEVIPEVLGIANDEEGSLPVEKPIYCPCCQSLLDETSANLFCRNHSGCKDQIVAKLVHFSHRNAMNIEGLSDKTALSLYELLNVRNFSDLFNLKRENLEKIDGFRDRKISNLLQSIEKSKKVSLSNFIFALGIDGVGSKTAADIAKKFKNIRALEVALQSELMEIDGVGEVIARDIVDYFSDDYNRAEIERLSTIGIDPIFEQDVVSSVLLGEKVVLTGSLSTYSRDDAIKILESLGAEIVSSVSKNTTLVVVGEKPGSKFVKAKQLGIRTIDEKEFIKLIAK